MNFQRRITHFNSWCVRIALGSSAVFLSSALSIAVAANEPDAAPPAGAELPQTRTSAQNKNALPPADKLKTTKRTDQTLLAAPTGSDGNAVYGSAELMQKTFWAMQEQQEQLTKEYQEAMQSMQQSLPRSVQLDIERQGLQKRLAEAQARILELSARREQALISPLPANAELRAFKLEYVKPKVIGDALRNITGGGGPRVAIDELSNAVIIAGDAKQIGVAEQLVKTLDQPAKQKQTMVAETLQVRIVWLLDGLRDRDPNPPKTSIVSSQVIDALHDLGFEQPQVVCQQLTTMTIGAPDFRGKFHFEVPTLIEDATWQFKAQGTIEPTPVDRYALEFNFDVRQPDNTMPSQFGGSIVTPLDHYTVLGTTTFVGPTAEGKSGLAEHLSAFVVHIERAKEFSGTPAAK